jgi:tetratricopeptide (TPR) repeat protein
MKVFISYSSKDKEKVGPLVEQLRKAGVEVWIDEMRLAGGETLWPVISNAINDNEWFVPVLSPHSLESEWFHLEVRRAYSTKKEKTIPLLVSKSLDLMEFPKWLAEKHAPLITEPEKVLKAIDFDRYDNLLSRARNHYKEDRYQEAIDAYNAAIGKLEKLPKDDLRDSMLYIELSRVFRAAKRFPEAVAAATKAIDSKGSAAAFLQRAKCAFDNKDVDIAVEDFRSCLKLEPDDAAALNGLGVALFQYNRDSPTAIAEIFRRAIAICESQQKGKWDNSIRHKLYTHLGFVLEKQIRSNPVNRKDLLIEAAACFRKAVQIDPSDQKNRFSLAYTEHRLSNLNSAIEHYRQINSRDFPRANFCLGYALYENQQYAQAVKAFEQGASYFQSFKEVDARAGCFIGIARCYLKLNRAVEAERYAKEAVELQKGDIRASLVYAEALQMKGDSQQAAIIAQSVADFGCVRALELLASLCGTDSTAGRKYAEQSRKMKGVEEPSFFKILFGIRQELANKGSVAFEPAEVIDSEQAPSSCHLRKWKCGEKCCI